MIYSKRPEIVKDRDGCIFTLNQYGIRCIVVALMFPCVALKFMYMYATVNIENLQGQELIFDSIYRSFAV